MEVEELPLSWSADQSHAATEAGVSKHLQGCMLIPARKFAVQEAVAAALLLS